MWQVLTRFAVNLSTYFILSQHVSQNCNVFINRPNITLAYLSFQLCIQDALASNLTQEAGHVDWYFTGIVLHVKLLLFVSIWLVIMFISWSIWSMCCSALWNFMHVSTNTGNSCYVSSHWKLYLAHTVPLRVQRYDAHQRPSLVQSQAIQGILARIAQCPPRSVGKGNAFITRIHTEIWTQPKQQLILDKQTHWMLTTITGECKNVTTALKYSLVSILL